MKSQWADEYKNGDKYQKWVFKAIWQKEKDGWETVFFGADNRIWTGDLILTKDALYHLSYISKKYKVSKNLPK